MKKGFTLIELLAVVLVLGVVGLIIMPKVNNTLKNQKRNLYEKQVDTIEKLAETYGAKHTEILPDSGVVYVPLEDIAASESLKPSDLKDPRNDEEIVGCVAISFDEQYNQYTYQFININDDGYNNQCN